MTDDEKEQFRLLVKYVNAGSDLAESLVRDLRKGNTISMPTVERLSKYAQAAKDAAKLLKRFKKKEYSFEN